MRFLVACAALPVVISFTTSSLGDIARPTWHRGQRYSFSCGNQHNCCRVSNPSSLLRSVPGSRRRSREGSVRQSVGKSDELGEGSANLDDSDDGPVEDSEMYASLRARLVELETKAALEQQQQQQFQVTRRRMSEESRSREVVATSQRSPEERIRGIALLTIQSLGVISVALLFGTAVLYWLAGDYFVHFGPRAYPGASPRSEDRQPGIERSVDGGRSEEEGVAGEAPRRVMGGSATRDPFHFEGFPDASSGIPTAVKPDF